MIDYRFPFDEQLLQALNGHGWSWLDSLWVAASSKLFGVGSAVVVGLWLLLTLRRRAVRPVFGAALALFISDTFGHQVLKPLFQRLRPPFALPKDAVRQLVETSVNAGSLPSLHAANSFAFAVALGLALPGSWRITLPLAALISLSRVGTGVHWPSDVAAGALYGALVGLLVHRVLQRLAMPPAAPKAA